MDELTLLLDRAVLASLDGTETPPVGMIRQRARRRRLTRTAVSVSLVLAMTVGGVIGLAGAGRASEVPHDAASVSAAAE